jgi:hypothetical protein
MRSSQYNPASFGASMAMTIGCEILSLDWSNSMQWHMLCEGGEDELVRRIDLLTVQVETPETLIQHCYVLLFQSRLDGVPELDVLLRRRTSWRQTSFERVGLTTVHAAIWCHLPLVGLHGTYTKLTSHTISAQKYLVLEGGDVCFLMKHAHF